MRPLLLSASLMLLASVAWADPSASLEGPTAGWRHDGLLERSADARVAYPTPASPTRRRPSIAAASAAAA